MATKSEVQGIVVSDKMEKSVVVAIARKIRHGLYGKTQRRTSRFVAHDDTNDARVGDRVAMAEVRPMSRRKRWVVTRVIKRGRGV